MTNAVIFTVFPTMILFSIKSRLKSGCGSDAPEKIKPNDANPAHSPYHTAAAIDGMTCSHCAQRIEHVFNAQSGVMAKVNLSRDRADAYSKSPILEGDVRRLVAQAGYPSKEIQIMQVEFKRYGSSRRTPNEDACKVEHDVSGTTLAAVMRRAQGEQSGAARLFFRLNAKGLLHNDSETVPLRYGLRGLRRAGGAPAP